MEEKKLNKEIVKSTDLNVEEKKKLIEGISTLFSSGSDSDKKMILQELFSPKNKKTITHLSGEEIMFVDRALVFHDYFISKNMFKSAKLLRQFYDEFITLRISLDRLSRIEFIEGFKIERSNDLDEKRVMIDKVR